MSDPVDFKTRTGIEFIALGAGLGDTTFLGAWEAYKQAMGQVGEPAGASEQQAFTAGIKLVFDILDSQGTDEAVSKRLRVLQATTSVAVAHFGLASAVLGKAGG